MEVHCVGDILCLVEVEPEANTLLYHDIENSANDFEKWFPKNNFVSHEEDTVTFETDPLLSEAQVFDKPTVLEGFEIIQRSQPIPKKPKPKDSPATILRSITKKRDDSSNPDTNTSEEYNGKPINDIATKYDVLLNKVLQTVEINVVNSCASITFKDDDENQIFMTQHMQLPENYAQPEKIHKIVNVSLVPICKELDYTLPQIITHFGLKIHLCPLHCSKAFLHIADAKLHTLKHMQIKPYKCDKPDCPWEFYTACKLQRHKETHEKNKNFVCDIVNCNRTFSTIYNLNEHKRKHNLPASLPCPVKGCDLFFQNEKQRRVHYKCHNSSEAPYSCSSGKCTRAFFTQNLLEAHVRACRESEIICKYPSCGKTFKNPYRLREHIRQHTGAKPYQCHFENCTWRFSTASKLKRHQSIHTRDRKFHCTIGDCTKSFLRSEHLKDHTLTHIEKKTSESEGKWTGQCKKQNSEKKQECTKIDVEDDLTSNNNNADVLLEQAIQSLGVPSDIILGTGLIPDESLPLLENESFSTVNLRDLD